MASVRRSSHWCGRAHQVQLQIADSSRSCPEHGFHIARLAHECLDNKTKRAQRKGKGRKQAEQSETKQNKTKTNKRFVSQEREAITMPASSQQGPQLTCASGTKHLFGAHAGFTRQVGLFVAPFQPATINTKGSPGPACLGWLKAEPKQSKRGSQWGESAGSLMLNSA